MKNLLFTKMQGLGNDFVVINNLVQNIQLSTEKIRLIADRHFGIGCDQILLLEPAPQANVDFGYRIFNNDGTESGQCGNGVRCLARFIQHHQLSSKKVLTIATSTTIMQVELLDNELVKVNMGHPRFSPSSLPMLLAEQLEYSLFIVGKNIHFSALSVGNPHIIIRVEKFEDAEIELLGHAFNQHATFPEGVNVGFMQIISRHHIHLRVFERGAGETLACGSGACAAMVAAYRHGWVDNDVQVTLPGGNLKVQWSEDTSIWMTGPAQFVFEGTYKI